MNKVLFSKQSDNWRTPLIIYNHYIEMNFFDPCPYESNFDGLEIEWKEWNFVNPPYSQIIKWIDKSIKEHEKGKEIILLLPVRTDTKWFKKLVNYGCYIMFITGRLHFNNSNSAPFPSCYIRLTGEETICVWRDRFIGE